MRLQANYVIVKAYYYTSLTSVQLLDCSTIAYVMVLSRVFLKVNIAAVETESQYEQ